MNNIYSPPGTKVKLISQTNGWPCDVKQIAELGLQLGQIFTIDHTVVHSSLTDVYLVELPSYCFNSVNFIELE